MSISAVNYQFDHPNYPVIVSNRLSCHKTNYYYLSHCLRPLDINRQVVGSNPIADLLNQIVSLVLVNQITLLRLVDNLYYKLDIYLNQLTFTVSQNPIKL